MARPFRDKEFPAQPYPGARPAGSFVHLDGTGHPLGRRYGRWSVGADDLDDWLAAHGAPPLEQRRPLLAYGSNACPSKITWLRETYGLAGPVVVLAAVCAGLTAVWAAGFRVVDEQRPATLAAAPGAVEQHALWLATPEQIEVLDRCEGRGVRYDLARLDTGTVMVDGVPVERSLAYVGRAAARLPLLVGGAPVRCADLPQAAAAALVGVPATTHGLVCQVLP